MLQKLLIYTILHRGKKKNKVLHFYPADKDFPIKKIYTLVIEGKSEERGSIFYPTIIAALIKPDKFLGLWIPSHQDWERLEKSPVPLCNISFFKSKCPN